MENKDIIQEIKEIILDNTTKEEDGVIKEAWLNDVDLKEIYTLLDNLKETPKSSNSRVKHPSYYQYPNGLEIWDIAKYHDFDIGNAMKYLSRCGRKEEEGMSLLEKEIEDLTKAQEYIADKINLLINKQNGSKKMDCGALK